MFESISEITVHTILEFVCLFILIIIEVPEIAPSVNIRAAVLLDPNDLQGKVCLLTQW